VDGKGGEDRTVYLSPQALEAIQQWRVTLASQEPTSPLFPSRKGGGTMKPTTVVALIQRRMQEAGIVNASSHSLRRTHAQGLERMGVGVRTIQRQLGHHHIHTTEIYLSKNPIGHRDAVRRLEFKA
jgi:integrase/recombinase XerD